jgi:hypothetical protein
MGLVLYIPSVLGKDKMRSIGTGTKNRREDQWNRIEDLDMNLLNYTHLIFDKGAKNI